MIGNDCIITTIGVLQNYALDRQSAKPFFINFFFI